MQIDKTIYQDSTCLSMCTQMVDKGLPVITMEEYLLWLGQQDPLELVDNRPSKEPDDSIMRKFAAWKGWKIPINTQAWCYWHDEDGDAIAATDTEVSNWFRESHLANSFVGTMGGLIRMLKKAVYDYMRYLVEEDERKKEEEKKEEHAIEFTL